VQVKVGTSHGEARSVPSSLKNAGAQRTSLLAREHEGIWCCLHPRIEMGYRLGKEMRWDRHGSYASSGLGRPNEQSAVLELIDDTFNTDLAMEEVEILALESE
jgi:hypothetical protein